MEATRERNYNDKCLILILSSTSSSWRSSEQPNVLPGAILEGVFVRGKKSRTSQRAAGQQTRSLHRRVVVGQRREEGLLRRVRRRRR